MRARKRLFVTGLGGFVGHWLLVEMRAAGWTIGGTIHPDERARKKNIDADVTAVDLLDTRRLHTAIDKFKPSHVIHLAAFSSVGQSMSQERLVYQTNLEGTVSLLTAVGELPLQRFLLVSSADVYGRGDTKGSARKESEQLRPLSPYGISKAAAEGAALVHFRHTGLPVTIVRAFNHTGPGQRTDFAIPAFASQIAEIETGRRAPILRVGDLSAKRDFSDVRDIVRGYHLLLRHGISGEVYNLGSGRAVSIAAVLRELISMARVKPIVETDAHRLRKADIPHLQADLRKTTQATGYRGRYTLTTTLRDTLDYWRARHAGTRA